MLKIVAIKLNTIYPCHGKVVSRLFTKTSNALQHNHIQEYKRWSNKKQTKNEEKDSNSSNASLFKSACLGFSSPDHTSNTPINGCNARDKILARFKRCCCGFLSTLYKSFGL